MSVAVVITNASEAVPLVGWAWQCARAQDEDIIVLIPAGEEAAEDAEPMPSVRAVVSDLTDSHARMIAVHQDLAPEQAKPQNEAADERCPRVEIKQVKGSDPRKDLLTAIHENGIKLLVLAKHAKARGDEDVLPVFLFRESRCMVVLLRLGGESKGIACRRVLVPTSGGPHATEALRLADKIAQLPDTSCWIDSGGVVGVDALFVEPDIGPEAESVGKRILEKAIRKSVGEASSGKTVRPIVEIANDFRSGLTQAVEQGKYDLVLIGAASQWHARRALFSMLPNELMDEDSTLTVGVVRQARPLTSELAERVRQLLSRGVPQLDREDRVSLVERVQSASQWNVDFIALIALSTAIATLGLMQNSAAVVIGAMLVAPLMTPLIGCGLAVVQGNGQLLRGAIKSVALGFLLALFIGFVMGTVIPHAGLTNEMLSRGKPNALDLAVALISGIAAAYATARPNLLGALPGVAIAAALVPPIATSGVALSHGELVTSAGAAMLFITNIVAIVLGAAAALFAVGMQAKHLHAREKRWTRHAVMGLTVGAVVLSVPLMYFLYASLPHAKVPSVLERMLVMRVLENPDRRVESVSYLGKIDGMQTYEINLTSDDLIEPALIEDLDTILDEYYEKDCRVIVRTILVARSND